MWNWLNSPPDLTRWQIVALMTVCQLVWSVCDVIIARRRERRAIRALTAELDRMKGTPRS